MDVSDRKISRMPAVWLCGLALVAVLFMSVEKESVRTFAEMNTLIQQSFSDSLSDQIYGYFLPVYACGGNADKKEISWGNAAISRISAWYGYCLKEWKSSELQEALLSLEEAAQKEAAVREAEKDTQIQIVEVTGEGEEADGEEELRQLLQAENEAAMQVLLALEQAKTNKIFRPNEKQTELDMTALEDYETLVKQMYTIDSNTMAGSNWLDVTRFMEYDVTVDKGGDEPVILIYHTHSQEGFADSVPGDDRTTIMGVGEYLAQILEEQYGYSVLHHTGQYDVESRDDAYSKSLPAVEQLLEEHPSIQVIIDLHRDQMPAETRLVTDVCGRPTARFMFFNGLSRTKKTGEIDYLYNDNLDENLAFSFQMQKAAMEYYPGLTRKIYLKGYRYNMHLRPRTLLIELGAQNNTLEEAMNAVEPLAHILNLVLSKEE